MAAHAATDTQFSGSLDALVLINPYAFHLLADTRCQDPPALGECEEILKSLVAHAQNESWDQFNCAYSEFFAPESKRDLLTAALPASHEGIKENESERESARARQRER